MTSRDTNLLGGRVWSSEIPHVKQGLDCSEHMHMELVHKSIVDI